MDVCSSQHHCKLLSVWLFKGLQVYQCSSRLDCGMQSKACGLQSEVKGHLGSDRHSFPRATAAFRCTAVFLASPAAWRSSSSTISVPSRLLAIPSSSTQRLRHRAAFPATISSLPGASKRRKMERSVQSKRITNTKRATLLLLH